MIEHSNAIKCPNVGYQLAGTKVIQASLCIQENLDKFLTTEKSNILKKCFAEQYSFCLLHNVEHKQQIIDRALQNNSNEWVLKPQREGGGNNFYGNELNLFLRKNRFDDKVLNGYYFFSL
jgi:glutathione synthase